MAHEPIADQIKGFSALVTAEATARVAGDLTSDFNDLGAAADAAALAPTTSGGYTITTAGAETNTLADPAFIGQIVSFLCIVYAAGDRVITAASAINQAGNTIMTFGAVDDFIQLIGVDTDGAGSLEWRVMSNDGAALS